MRCRCEHNITDECKEELDTCWKEVRTDKKGNKSQQSACVDNLPAYQVAAAMGDRADASAVPLSTCSCDVVPGCNKMDGKGRCVRACLQAFCDLAGRCHEEPVVRQLTDSEGYVMSRPSMKLTRVGGMILRVLQLSHDLPGALSR